MTSRRVLNPNARRAELIAAARSVIASKGLERFSVSDVVEAAGVAQGTFYLYFDTKSDAVDAVAQEMVEEMVQHVESSLAGEDGSAVDKLLAFRDALVDFMAAPASQEISGAYHQPENSEMHDRMAQEAISRMAPVMESIVRQGVDEGTFDVRDVGVASWFVLGGFHVLETGFADAASLSRAVSGATDCALRALGCIPQAAG